MIHSIGKTLGLGVVLAAMVLPGSDAPEKIGSRPYELVWANRMSDDHPPLVDFEDLTGWTVEVQNSVATLVRSREQQIWGQYVGKLTYRATGQNPQIRLRPPQPLPIKDAFDAVSLWVYGNNWGYSPDPRTPPVRISVLIADSQGRELQVPLHQVDWTEWFLLHRRLTDDQIERVKNGASFRGFLIVNGKNTEDRVLFFDNLAVFKESFPPLKFEPRPERGIPMFPGQSAGANTGPGRLPFPTRPQTILPNNLTRNFKTRLIREGNGWRLIYEGEDGQLIWRLAPETGTWSDLSAEWKPAGRKQPAAGPFKPCVGGGVWLQTAQGPKPPETVRLLETSQEKDSVKTRWQIGLSNISAEVQYTYKLWNKSLVIEVACPGGQVGEVRFGKATGLPEPRLATTPFYPAHGGRPAVVVSGGAEAPLFLTGHVDWYMSNGSILWARNGIDDNGVQYHGGTRYIQKTDGKRNDCFERFFVSISPRYEEVLATVPNPPSPWKHITGTRLWRAHGAGNRTNDMRFWADVHRHGITQMIVTDHETGWRDGGESFTFRTRPAPGKGGDAGQYEYARFMQDKLGFVYGPYNNFTDFAPVNEYWNYDMISRTPDRQLQNAWMRCYAPKPQRAVEFAARLPFIIQEKFHFSTAYCDVHTAVAPWDRVDYDERVPGAGTFAAVFYAYGEIMLLQKKAWNGPVYSEGNNHAFYCGLTDGNYGQDQSYRPAENPWLVDFDLRKLHDLSCNFGMGNPGMFYANERSRPGAEGRDAWVDRFLAATVAFGHPGFLVMEGGMAYGLRSYYMLQQLHSRYCLTNVVEIRYADNQGRLLDTSAAIASGAYRLSQVLARYADGTCTAANGSRSNRLSVVAWGRKLDLPPNGYAGWTARGDIEVLAADPKGHRCDYAATPEYLYVDGRGRFMRFPRAASSGVGICRILGGGEFEIIPFQGAEAGFAIQAGAVVALDRERKELGPASWRAARGLTYIEPVTNAFSYRVRGRLAPPTTRLSCARDEVVPGEEVFVRGKQLHTVKIPSDARPGQRIWQQLEGEWIDFTVVPLADMDIGLSSNALELKLTSHLPQTASFQLQAGARRQTISLAPETATIARIDLGAPAEESATVLPLQLYSGGLSLKKEIGLLVERGAVQICPLPAWTAGFCLRGGKEQSGTGAHGVIVHAQPTSCGGKSRNSIFMHPPWQGAVGYSFAVYEPITLPAGHPAAFRAYVGKADDSDLGDGILYQLKVLTDGQPPVLAGELLVTNHSWREFEADLSRWAGRRVRLQLITDVGARDNSSGDWGCWAEMRLESKYPLLRYELSPAVEKLRKEPGPYPAANLSVADLRKARAGWLRFDGKGLEGPGKYAVSAFLNGVALGALPSAPGNETEGKFTEKVRLQLPAAALQTLSARNRLLIENPNGDCFSLRRFWLELELADGRRCSSDISTATYSQPDSWNFAEGIKLPPKENIQLDIWFSGLKQ